MHPCIICGNRKLKRVIALGEHPLADSFLKDSESCSKQKRYPLNALLCTGCGHVQNEVFVSAEERYVETEYSYTSSNSPIAKKHWEEYASSLAHKIGLKPKDHVIEFGSNDGYLLQQFKKLKAEVTGIEPSPFLATLSKEQGVFTEQGFLDKKTMDAAVKRTGKPKLIIGNNVFNHLIELNEAVELIQKSLADDGLFVFEVPNLLDLVEHYAFDTMYHEHISYFSIRSADTLLRKHQLFINNIVHNNYQGGSIRISAGKEPKAYQKKEVEESIRKEEQESLFTPKRYEQFMEKITQDKEEVLEQLSTLKKQGKHIAAIGAATKGNTLMNFYGLDKDTIDFVTDVSPLKIGKYTPGSCLQIVHDNELSAGKIDVALILPWNIGKHLVEKIKKIHPKLQFIVPGEKGLL